MRNLNRFAKLFSRSTLLEGFLALGGAVLLTALLFALSPDQLTFTSGVSAQLLGVFALVVCGVVLTRFHLGHTPLSGVTPVTAGRILLVSSLVTIAGMQVLTLALGRREFAGSGVLFTTPLLIHAMVVSALIGPAISMFALTLVCLLVGVSGAAGIEMLVVSWIGGSVAAHAVNPLKHRNDLMRAMFVLAGSQALIAAGGLTSQNAPPMEILVGAGWGALGAIVATSVFWMSIVVLERAFGLTSDWSLVELCSPEHPLLRELVLRAPGTYAHSVMVGNLAENAAREIGANAVLARALAYFHDIGKLSRPSHFIENQTGENPHDHLPPRLSASILAAHVRDGLEMAQKHRLPRIIKDGIAQHHGTGVMSYFFHRARQQQPDVPAAELERGFRYPGPRPQTREVAILLLADSVEASSRNIPRGQSEELEIAVSRIVEERRADGQLDESELTFRDLIAIKQSFLRTLGAIRHERIVYPEDDLLYAAEEAADLDLRKLPTPPSHPEPPRGA